MKKRSIKKVLALGLAGAMLCGMLTACGGANGSSSAPSASSEGQAEPAAPETEKEKVVLWHLWTGVEAGYLDDAVAAYNAQSDKYYVEALSVPDFSENHGSDFNPATDPTLRMTLQTTSARMLRKGIMLPLGLPQIGDVVKEQSLQIFRHQIFQLPAGAVEHDALEPANFRRIMDSRLQDKLTPFPVKLWVCVLGLVFLEVLVSCTKCKISVGFAQKKRRISPPQPE